MCHTELSIYRQCFFGADADVMAIPGPLADVDNRYFQ